ncbi:MAG TPA: hypothetical protein VLL52_14015 [Anaerolineae bacterium]|nr:hypothetical protein [Anaerolineae bacterium]
MPQLSPTKQKTLYLLGTLFTGMLLLAMLFTTLYFNTNTATADPLPPPEGYPKLSLSLKTVSPTLTATGGDDLAYLIEIKNTGAYTAFDATLTDLIPANTTYNNDATTNSPNQPQFDVDTLSWTGDVGFDDTILISFTVAVAPNFDGVIENTAVISQAMLAEPVTITAATIVRDEPFFVIDKEATPLLPGPNQIMVYTLTVANEGQPATNFPIEVSDMVPNNTTIHDIGPDGSANGNNTIVTWNRNVNLAIGQTEIFTFAVQIGDVVSGTIINNNLYSVDWNGGGPSAGTPYTTTVINPILSLSKTNWPDPAGSNREMTYTLTIFNIGSKATDLTITDVVPDNVTYLRGGDHSAGVVSWDLPELDTNQSAQFTYTVWIDDIANVRIINDEYTACTADNICVDGPVVTTTVRGPNFVIDASLDPIAKKPGSGNDTGSVTPTITIENIGPGNALDAQVTLAFARISVGGNDLYVIPDVGTTPPFPDGPDCGDQCNSYLWNGDFPVGDIITFTTYEGQSTIGGSEGNIYSTTVVITDSLENTTTVPLTATAEGIVTHLSNLLPSKSAPEYIGAGQILTYTLNVYNTALSTDAPPWLTDTVPLSTTLINISDDGVATEIDGRTVISWTLPELSPGEGVQRNFAVRVDDDLISGTLILNDDYRVSWLEDNTSGVFSNTGKIVTTTIQEVGLIDSFKMVNPILASPGDNVLLTYTIHVVNSSLFPLSDVMVYDLLPWQASTYLRNAEVTAGTVISDIVSVSWTGDLAPLSEELITVTVLVDSWYQGALTNTAVITHPSLLHNVEVDAVAYVTDNPVLMISKAADADIVDLGDTLTYDLYVTNQGQQATQLVITDTIPANTTYIPDTATQGGTFDGEIVRWTTPVLAPGAVFRASFAVTVDTGPTIVNHDYRVSSREGVFDMGDIVETQVRGGGVYLPAILKN